MACLARIGLFETENHPMLGGAQRPTFASFLNELLADKNSASTNTLGSTENEQEMIKRLIMLKYCNDDAAATRTVKTIKLVDVNFFKLS